LLFPQVGGAPQAGVYPERAQPGTPVA
jgi:hypothetical protein